MVSRNYPFEFSQSSLQDFTDCRYRFLLRYIRNVAWPAVQAEPARENELHIQRGERFHRLAQQYLLGVPQDVLTRMADADPDPLIAVWWANFLEHIPGQLEGERFVEVTLRSPAGQYHLVAKYDLVLISPSGKVTIYDWKTTPKRPSRSRLLERLQTRVYPYLLACAGETLNRGRAVEPESIEMVYWFTHPDQPSETFIYSHEQFEHDRLFLNSLMEHINTLSEDQFDMAEDEKACSYCVYRSLCRRGTRAGALTGAEELVEEIDTGEFPFDLEQIGEISF